jgi:putative ABC transport system permease protein
MTPRRLFRALLRVLPFDFRADYGAEMEQVFELQRREAQGAAARARVWAGNMAAILAVGPREHLRQLWQDTRYALRGMVRTPGFAIVAVLTLALGTGVNTAIFSIVHAVMLDPLPYAEPSRLVTVMNAYGESTPLALSDPEYLDYAEQTRSLDIAAITPGHVTIAGGSADAERVPSVTATTNVLAVLGRQPSLGRGFMPADDERGSTAVLLSDDLWRTRFGADPGIVGRDVTIQGRPRRVVGVLPADLLLPFDLVSAAPAGVVLPATFDRAAPRHQRGGHYLTGIARLRSGVTLEAAAADMARVLAPLARQYPDQHDQGSFRVTVQPLREALVGDSRPVLLVLGSAVSLVLLLACANVANLMLARGEARRRELAVRAALGATRFRVIRQLLTEALLLAGIATGLGLAVARWTLDLVVAIAPSALPRLRGVSLNVEVLAYAAGVAVLASALFGVLPALQVSRARAGEALREGGRSGSAGGRARVRRALVICQVGLAVILLAGAGLLLKSYARILETPGGFATDHVLTARIAVPEARYPRPGGRVGLLHWPRRARSNAARRRIRGRRFGAAAGGRVGRLEFRHRGAPARERPPSRRRGLVRRHPRIFRSVADPAGCRPLAPGLGYYARARHRVAQRNRCPIDFSRRRPRGQAGSSSRGPAATNSPGAPSPGSSATFATRGSTSLPGPRSTSPHTQFQHFSPDVQARGMSLVVRSAVAPASLIPAVRAELKALDPQLPLADARPMEEVFARSVAPRRLHVLLVGAFAVLAIVLATVGIYGIVAYDVLQRRQEIGVRMALGASRRSVLALVLSQGMTLVLVGAAAGLAIAAALSGAMTPLLYAVEPRDVAVFAAVGALLAVTGLLAAWVPARRAAKVEPLTALRH